MSYRMKTILVVDDDEMILKMAEFILQQEGYEAVKAISEVKGIADITELNTAMVALAEAGVDAIYIPTDNVLANGASTVHAINIGQ